MNKTNLPSRGFALVIALSVMGFMLLLTLSLTTLMRVETATASVHQNQIEAQQAAVLALQLAIGDLQRYAGPDQRITGRSELLDNTPQTAQAENIANPFWTGVWDAQTHRNDHLDSGMHQPFNAAPADYHLQWLVSGNTDTTTINPAIPLPPESSVELVSESIPEQGDSVRAPLVDIGEQHYAWWIGDLGVRAKVGLERGDAARAKPGSITPENRAPLRAGIQVWNSFAKLDDDREARQTTLDNMVSRDQIDLLNWLTPPSNVDSVSRQYVHDLTTQSRSVIADVRDGGLKKDLTAGLQNGAPQPTGQIFDPIAGESTDLHRNPGGPLWDQLRSYFNLRPTGGELQPQGMTDERMAVHPVVAYWNLGYTFSLVTPSGDAPETFADIGPSVTVRIHLHPIIVLWNPYNQPMAAHTYHWYLPARQLNLGARVLFSDVQIWNKAQYSIAQILATREKPKNLPHTLGIDLPRDKDDAINQLFRSADNTSAKDRGTFKFAVECPRLEPGQGIVLSAPGYQPLETHDHFSYQNMPESRFNKLTAGWRNDTYFYQDDTDQIDAAQAAALGDLTEIKVKDIIMMPVARYGQKGNECYSLLAGSRSEITSSPMVFQERLRLWFDTTDFAQNANWQNIGWYMLPRWKSGQANQAVKVISAAHQTYLDFKPDVEPFAYPAFGYHNQIIFSEPESVNPDDEPSTVFRWLANHNPRATVFGQTPAEAASNQIGSALANGRGYRPDAAETYFKFGDEAFLGLSIFSPGIQECVLYETPTHERDISSIGELMHADLYRAGIDANSSFKETTTDAEGNNYFLGNNVSPAYAIGNSLADPRIPADQTYASQNDWRQSNPHVHYDQSYLLNDALWDRYFFSTTPHEDTSSSTPYNARMLATGVSSLTQLRDNGTLYDEAAANLMLDGAFNVNSTSTAAWEAVLASTLGVATDSGNADANRAPYQRFDEAALNPAAPRIADELDPFATEAYASNRALTPDDIRELAAAIVEQVKTRGPFFSMSQFVNRTLTDDANNSARLNGPLQAAIDQAQLNAALNDPDLYVSEAMAKSALDDRDYHFDFLSGDGDTDSGRRTVGLPTDLTQADILARLGSALTVRSDTFVIRAYGEKVNPLTGDVESQAWCEAIVQRTPDFMNPHLDAASTPLNQLTDADNAKFGRRFQMVSFRWLNKEEI